MESGERAQAIEDALEPLHNLHDEAQDGIAQVLKEQLDGERSLRFHLDRFIRHHKGNIPLCKIFHAHIDGISVCVGDLPALEFVILFDGLRINHNIDGAARLIITGAAAAGDRNIVEEADIQLLRCGSIVAGILFPRRIRCGYGIRAALCVIIQLEGCHILNTLALDDEILCQRIAVQRIGDGALRSEFPLPVTMIRRAASSISQSIGNSLDTGLTTTFTGMKVSA